LLNHTGGTGDIFGPEFDNRRAELRTLQDYIKLYGSRAPRFKPGSRFEYSNYGFILLGAVIERVTGETYYRFVGEHIYTGRHDLYRSGTKRSTGRGTQHSLHSGGIGAVASD